MTKQLENDRINNHSAILITLIVALGAWIRLIHIGKHSLWLDEIGQVIVASYPAKQVFGLIAQHLSPPLDYLIIKGILYFGHTEFIVRMPAFFFGVMTVILIFLWLREMVDSKIAILAATLMACSPMAIAYSQEVRMYSLFLMLATLNYWLIVRFVKNSTWPRALLLGICNTLLLWAHYFGLFLVATQAALLIILFWMKQPGKDYILKISFIYLINIITFLPWVPYLLQQIQHSHGQIGYALKPSADYFKWIFTEFSSSTGSRDIWFTLFLSGYIYSFWVAYRQKNWTMLISQILMLSVLMGLFIISFYKQVVTSRNMIFLLPIFYASLALVINELMKKAKLKLWVGVIIVTALMAWPVYHYHTFGRPDYKPNFKEAAQYIQSRLKPNEHVVTTDIHNRGCIAYYLDSEASNVFMRPEWTSPQNNPNWIVWNADSEILSQIQDGTWKGWVILPPNLMDEKMEKALRERVNQPVKSFPTQGRGRDLELYYLD